MKRRKDKRPKVRIRVKKPKSTGILYRVLMGYDNLDNNTPEFEIVELRRESIKTNRITKDAEDMLYDFLEVAGIRGTNARIVSYSYQPAMVDKIEKMNYKSRDRSGILVRKRVG